MKFIEVTTVCPLCRRQILLQADPCCPPDWADALAKLVICDACANFRSSTEQLTSRIGFLCGKLFALRGSKVAPEESKRLREALVHSTKAFTRAYSTFYRNPSLAWSPDFVDFLMESPEKWGAALGYIRGQLRKQARETPNPIMEGTHGTHDPIQPTPSLQLPERAESAGS